MRDYKNIPDSLKILKIWTGCMYADNPEKEKPDKLPINPYTLQGAKSTDSATWSNFSEAVDSIGKSAQCYVKRKDENGVKQDVLYRGTVADIGIMFDLNYGIFGVDLDHVVNTDRTLTAEAQDIIKTLDSYTEFSQSGTGIHIICRGILPPGARKNEPVEMYNDKRAFIMTGNIYGEFKDIQERTAEAAAIHAKYLTKVDPQVQTKQPARTESIETKFSDILNRLNGVSPKGDEYNAFCPVCENGKTSGDRHLYLSVDGEKILLHCKKGCSVDAICRAMSKTAADLFESTKKPQPWKFIREHIYYDAQGNIFAKKVIYRKPDSDKVGIWYRYEHEQYIKSLDGNKPLMYNMPLLVNTRDGDRVFIVEGEKDADTLCGMGYITTTAPNGAGQAKIPEDCKEYFRGRDIIIMGDNDEPGRKYADVLYNTLRIIGRQVVKIEPAALWDILPEKGDISDIYQALGEDETRVKLEEAITGAFIEDLYLRPYIFKDGDKEKVSAPFLHEYIRNHEHYIFARSDSKGSVQRYIYRNGVYRHISDDEFKGVIRDYLPVPLHSTRTINEVFNLFSMDADRFIQIDDLDSDENIINFRNGILCLNTMKIIPHSPEHLSTIQIPVVYNPEAEMPCDSIFEFFLEHLTEGDPDRRQLILEFMGVSLSNVAGYRMKKALFMYGQGNTGKSQCKELLIKLLGAGRYSGIDLDALEERFGTSQLFCKRLAGSSDMGYVTVKGLRVIKLLTGGDSVFAEFKGENAFTYKYKGVLWFCANRMPRFGGDKGDHVYERIMILPCNNVVTNPDPKLLDKMYAEKEYIVRICVEAVKKLINNNYRYTEPECSRDEMKIYRVKNDSVLTFLKEFTEPRIPGAYINDSFTTGRIYRLYKRWSIINNGGHSETRDVFNSTLKAAGVTERTLHGNTYYSIVPITSVVSEYDSFANG